MEPAHALPLSLRRTDEERALDSMVSSGTPTSEDGTGACCAILPIFVTGSFRKWNRRGFACFPWYTFGVLDSLSTSMVARIIWVPW